jgi:glycosyltransferase involved in cell wall biosynthesis
MAKIVHLMHFVAHGRLEKEHVSSGSRGVTGSEQALMAFAETAAEAGHRVVVYVPTSEDFLHNGVWYKDLFSRYPRLDDLDDADCVVAWLSGDPLVRVSPRALRVMVLQINDWSMCTTSDPLFPHVDRFVIQSQPHVESLWTKSLHPVDRDRVVVIPNGVRMDRFVGIRPRVRHRIIACSSPDRGLHWMLYLWPQIRHAVPDATLHIFYEVRKWIQSVETHANEIGQRGRYMAEKLPLLESHGVVLRGAVSPAEIAQELLRSDVMAYPCDPVSFTEGFSCSTMEACAAGTVPIITNADALGEIYRDSGAIIVPRGSGSGWIEQYRDHLIRALQCQDDPADAVAFEDRRKQCRQFAANFDYSIVGKQFQEMLDEGMARKQGDVDERTVVAYPGARLAGRNSVSNVRADGGVDPQSS